MSEDVRNMFKFVSVTHLKQLNKERKAKPCKRLHKHCHECCISFHLQATPIYH